MSLQIRRLVISVALGVAAAAIVVPARPAAQQQQELDARFLDFWKQLPRVPVPVAPGDAKVVVVKFNDWMCPGCRIWYEMLRPVLAKYRGTGAVKYVEKDWPWNSQCNPSVQQTIPGHEASCAAAAAVRLAADAGKREAMAEWLYAHQPETDTARRTMVARVRAKTEEMLGLSNFDAAYAAKLPEIRKDIAEGVALQVQSTPTYFINGVRPADQTGRLFTVHYIDLAIQYELKN